MRLIASLKGSRLGHVEVRNRIRSSYEFSYLALRLNTLLFCPTAACDALPGFIPYVSTLIMANYKTDDDGCIRYLTGGNDGLIPYYFVGYWPTEDSGAPFILVAHKPC